MMQTPVGGNESRVESRARGRGPATLIDHEPWDQYDLDSLLPLADGCQMSTAFGFLIRHYWIPATRLLFRRSCRQTWPDGGQTRRESWIQRRMVRCTTTRCVWREKEVPDVCANGNGVKALDDAYEMIHHYECFEHTFRSQRPVSSEGPIPVEATEARRRALWALPMIVPPGCVTLGSCWHGEVEGDYMEYRLEAERRVGEMAVLLVRREGRYTTWLSGGPADDPARRTPVVTQRRGVTAVALNRSVVLEDRVVDRVVGVGYEGVGDRGTETQMVTRLIRSWPARD